jgi:hypothetical protein
MKTQINIMTSAEKIKQIRRWYVETLQLKDGSL